MTNQIEQFKREYSLSLGAKAHIEERLFNVDIVNQFDIGFCPVCSNYSFDLINGRLIVPIYDVYGEFIAFAGRRLEYYGTNVKNYYQKETSLLNGLEKYLKWKTSKWINTPYKKSDHLFNLNNAKRTIFETGLCIIVEGYFDVMYLTQMGFKNVVALCGTSLTDRQCELIFRYCNKVLMILDGDDAGKNATVKAVYKARSKNLFANVVQLPDSTDPDQLDREILAKILDTVANTDEELYIKL